MRGGMNRLADTDTDTLVARWASVDRQLQLQQEIKGKIEMELERRMRQDGARELQHPDYVIRLESPTPTYDQGILLTLREFIAEHEFARGYFPEATIEIKVDAKFNMTVVKSWGTRFGGEVAATIARARHPLLPGKLRIYPKKAEGGE